MLSSKEESLIKLSNSKESEIEILLLFCVGGNSFNSFLSRLGKSSAWRVYKTLSSWIIFECINLQDSMFFKFYIWNLFVFEIPRLKLHFASHYISSRDQGPFRLKKVCFNDNVSF